MNPLAKVVVLLHENCLPGVGRSWQGFDSVVLDCLRHRTAPDHGPLGIVFHCEGEMTEEAGIKDQLNLSTTIKMDWQYQCIAIFGSLHHISVGEKCDGQKVPADARSLYCLDSFTVQCSRWVCEYWILDCHCHIAKISSKAFHRGSMLINLLWCSVTCWCIFDSYLANRCDRCLKHQCQSGWQTITEKKNRKFTNQDKALNFCPKKNQKHEYRHTYTHKNTHSNRN